MVPSGERQGGGEGDKKKRNKLKGTVGWRGGCGQRAGGLDFIIMEAQTWRGEPGAGWVVHVGDGKSHGLHLLTLCSLLRRLQSVTTLHPTAFPKVSDDLRIFKSKHLLILILLDFSATSDTVNHSLLLKWSRSLASKTTHSAYFFPASPAPVYWSPLEVHLPPPIHSLREFLNRR